MEILAYRGEFYPITKVKKIKKYLCPKCKTEYKDIIESINGLYYFCRCGYFRKVRTDKKRE